MASVEESEVRERKLSKVGASGRCAPTRYVRRSGSRRGGAPVPTAKDTTLQRSNGRKTPARRLRWDPCPLMHDGWNQTVETASYALSISDSHRFFDCTSRPSIAIPFAVLSMQ